METGQNKDKDKDIDNDINNIREDSDARDARDYKEEVIFYLAITILRRFIREQYFYIDEYKDAIDKIYIDYKDEHDDYTCSLLESIDRYIELKYNYIADTIKPCIP